MNYKVLPSPVLIDVYRTDLKKRIGVNARRVVFSGYAGINAFLHRSTMSNDMVVTESHSGYLISIGHSPESACQSSWERLRLRSQEWIQTIIRSHAIRR